MSDSNEKISDQVFPNFTLAGNNGNYRLSEIPPVVPIVPTRDTVIFPFSISTFLITDEQAIKLVNEVAIGDRLMGIVSLKDKQGNLSADNLYHHGTLVYVHRLFKAKEGMVQVIIQALPRILIKEIVASSPFIRARITRAQEEPIETADREGEALIRQLKDLYIRFVSLTGQVADEIAKFITGMSDSRQLVYLIASSIPMEVGIAQEIISSDSIKEKARRLIELISREIEVFDLGTKIRNEAKSEIDKTQKEYILRQQLKAIQNELGEGEEQRKRTEQFKEKISKSGMSPEGQKEALRELTRLEAMQPGTAEYPMIENYLEWLTEIPWQVVSEESLDITVARGILEAEHYGLKDIKSRIIEDLTVRKLKIERQHLIKDESGPTLRPEREGAILCFVGPPGVGKTSLGVSIAHALGRKFIRLSLGGMRDEAEIRGHRRTYIGAAPGRIIQLLRRVGTKNPVIMLDEIDKVGADWRGDPSSALLEVLDPEQNREFRDNYLNVPFDLSQVLFIATANILDTIPAPLRDRMEVIQLSGYTDTEKLQIARNYLVERQIRENGLESGEVTINEEALLTIIRDYTREAGVRELERQLGKICRSIAVDIVENRPESKEVSVSDVRRILGKARFFHEAKERTDTPGVSIGLAYTPVGGDILFIEATRMEGTMRFSVTGQLGEVMKESAQTALSLIRSRASRLGIDPNIFSKNEIHLHVPAGAVPKDGPSAGVAMAVALASLLLNRTVNPDLGMSGEITLRGKVLPVGGIKEKLIAAHRAGLKTVLIPHHNEMDLEELPQEVKEGLQIILVTQIDEVLHHALDLEVSDQKEREHIEDTQWAHEEIAPH